MGAVSQAHSSTAQEHRQGDRYVLGGPAPWPMARFPTELLAALRWAGLTPHQRAVVDLVAEHVYGPDLQMAQEGVPASYAGLCRALEMPPENVTQVRRAVTVLLERGILLRWPDPAVYNGFRYHLGEPASWDQGRAAPAPLVLLPRRVVPSRSAAEAPVDDRAEAGGGSAPPSVRTPGGGSLIRSDQTRSLPRTLADPPAENRQKAAASGEGKARWSVEQLYVRRGSGKRYTTTLLVDAVGDVLDNLEASGRAAWALVGPTVEATDEHLAVVVSEGLAESWDGRWKPSVVRLALVAAAATRAERALLHVAEEQERVRARSEDVLGWVERVRADALQAIRAGDAEGLEGEGAALRGELLDLARGVETLRRGELGELAVVEAMLDGVKDATVTLQALAYTRSDTRKREIEAREAQIAEAAAREATEALLPELEAMAQNLAQTLDAAGVGPARTAVAQTRSGRLRRWETEPERREREAAEHEIRVWRAWRWRVGATREAVEQALSNARWRLRTDRAPGFASLSSQLSPLHELLGRAQKLLAEPPWRPGHHEETLEREPGASEPGPALGVSDRWKALDKPRRDP